MLHHSYVLLLVIFVAGCSHNYYNIPRDVYEKKVRILGIAPIMIDPGSDIKHPDREPLRNLIKEVNRRNEKELVAQVKGTGVYFTVGLLDEDAEQLFTKLFFRRERRDDAGILYNKYFFKGAELKNLIEKNTLDAVMLVVVSGQMRPDKIYSSNYLSFLQSDYNYLIVTAQILDADGTILWEYPNFRKRSLSFSPLVSLQYPDFDEAAANVTDYVEIKFKTIPGLARAFNRAEASSLQKNTRVSVLYGNIFEDMVSLLGPEQKFPWSEKKSERKEGPKAEEQKKAAPEQASHKKEDPVKEDVRVEPARKEEGKKEIRDAEEPKKEEPVLTPVR
jgi:hypothetical protein